MSPFDLLAILSVLATVGALVRVGYLLIRKRTAAARKTATMLATFVAIYAITLIVVSLVSPKKVLDGDGSVFRRMVHHGHQRVSAAKHR